MVVMIAVLACALSLTVFAQNSYIITDGSEVTVHKSYSDDPDVVLTEAGIELSEEDTYTTTYNDGVGRIDIQRMQMVTVIYKGEKSVVGTYGETVGALLQRMGIRLTTEDTLSCESEAVTFDGMEVTIVHREVEICTYEETVPYETKYFEDPELEPGEEIVLIQGVDGSVRYEAQVIREDGEEISRTVLKETVLTEAVTCLVVCGPNREITQQPDEPDHRVSASQVTTTANSGVITTSTGTTYNYTRTLNVLATAYSCEGYQGVTAIGTVARVGAIAVDPRVIPLGTKMYVVSNDGQYVYGYCVAEDTGGLIKGNRIDLYFDTEDECWDFGVRYCTVYILG